MTRKEAYRIARYVNIGISVPGKPREFLAIPEYRKELKTWVVIISKFSAEGEK